MGSSEQYPLTEQVHVDEFEIGTPQKGEQGRSKSASKVRVVIAIEYREGQAGVMPKLSKITVQSH